MKARTASLLMLLLWLTAFCLAIHISRSAPGPGLSEESSFNPLETLLGDSRRVFASHAFVKADVYFHSGYYPSLFDDASSYHTPHVALYADAVDQEKHLRAASRKGRLANLLRPDDEGGTPGESTDWIARWSESFHPVRHTHLDQQGRPGDIREILPWFKLAASLDPQNVDAYVVASYWLRRELKAVDEAEDFLREGLRHNPNSPELYFELGRIQMEHRRDVSRARNLWRLGMLKWHESEAHKPEPNEFIYAQLAAHLARLAEGEDDPARAWWHVEALRLAAPQRNLADWQTRLWQQLRQYEWVMEATDATKATP